jgi:hypothetical protein
VDSRGFQIGPDLYTKRNRFVEEKFNEAVATLFEVGFRPWLREEVEKVRDITKIEPISFSPDPFRLNPVFFPFVYARDTRLIRSTRGQNMDGLFTWRFTQDLPTLDTPPTDDELSVLAAVRGRVRWIVTLCDGLSAGPIIVPSGQMRSRMTTRLVVHPHQAEQDALNEFAAKLVHPRKRYVAHVRMQSDYHETKLWPPVDRGAGEGVRVPNPIQPDDIRTRSRELYDTSAEQVTPPPSVRPQHPPITRKSPITPASQDDLQMRSVTMTITSSDKRQRHSRRELRAGAAEGLSRKAADAVARSSVWGFESTSSVSVDPGEIATIDDSAGG